MVSNDQYQPFITNGKGNRFSCSKWSVSITLLLILGITFLFSHPALATSTLEPFDTTQEAVDDDEQAAKIDSLIQLLGNPDFIVRDESEADLIKIGEPAIKPLRKLLTHKNDSATDNEVRLRAVRLLIIIEREVNQQNLNNFLKGKSETIHYPGWPEFSNIAGSDSKARRLFVTTFESNKELIETFFSTNSTADQKKLESKFSNVATRSFRVNSYTNPNRLVPTLTAILFTASLEQKWNGQPNKISISESEYTHLRNGIVHDRMNAAINNHFAKKIIHRLIAHWINSITDESTTLAVTKMKIIDSYQLRQSSKLTLELALDSSLPASTRAMAIEILSRIGNRKTVNDLKPLLNDAELIGTYLPTDSTAATAPKTSKPKRLLELQIRDLALATSILLKEKKLENYGFIPTAFDDKKLIANQAGFFSDKDRLAAITKWKSDDNK